jgi:uncharacterized protein YaeQ
MLAKQPDDKQIAYTTIKCLRIVFKLESRTASAWMVQTIIKLIATANLKMILNSKHHLAIVEPNPLL